MRRFLLDTGIAGAFINRRGGVRERVRQEVASGNRVGIGTPVLAELAFGIEYSQFQRGIFVISHFLGSSPTGRLSHERKVGREIGVRSRFH